MLTNTRQVIDDDSTRVIEMAESDAKRYPEIKERIRRYERLIGGTEY